MNCAVLYGCPPPEAAIPYEPWKPPPPDITNGPANLADYLEAQLAEMQKELTRLQRENEDLKQQLAVARTRRIVLRRPRGNVSR